MRDVDHSGAGWGFQEVLKMRCRSEYLLLFSIVAVLVFSVRLPSQICCTGDPPICDCGAYCDGTNWSCGTCSPIVIDVRGNGWSFTSATDGVWFDLAGNGVKKKMAWTASGSDDGFLALDRNGNAVIDDGSELFGNFTAQPLSPKPNGFLALAVFDKVENGGNGDGAISAEDAVYRNLRIWVDRSHNGLSEPDELFTLPQVDIFAISLRYQEHRWVDDYANQFRYRAKVTDSKGADVGKWAYDVFFVTDTTISFAQGFSKSSTLWSRAWLWIKDGLAGRKAPASVGLRRSQASAP